MTVTVFFAGLVLGGMLFPLSAHDEARTRTASNDTPAAISLLNGAPPVVRRERARAALAFSDTALKTMALLNKPRPF